MLELKPELTQGQRQRAAMAKQLKETQARQTFDRAASGAMWVVGGLSLMLSLSIVIIQLFGMIFGLSAALLVLGIWTTVTAVLLGRRA